MLKCIPSLSSLKVSGSTFHFLWRKDMFSAPRATKLSKALLCSPSALQYSNAGCHSHHVDGTVKFSETNACCFQQMAVLMWRIQMSSFLSTWWITQQYHFTLCSGNKFLFQGEVALFLLYYHWKYSVNHLPASIFPSGCLCSCITVLACVHPYSLGYS